MHNLLIIYPFLAFLLSAIGCLFFWGKVTAQKLVYLMGTSVALASSAFLLWQVAEQGILHIQVGAWPAPFGIALVVDIFSALMVSITALLGFVLYFYSYDAANIDMDRKQHGFYPSLLFMLMGITGAFITGDVFNLYVWFEVLLVSSFVLITLGSARQQLEGGIKYVTINFIASSFLLLGIGILYGITGSTNMADLALRLQQPDISGLAEVASMMLLVSFGIKAALFPLFFWLPASYHTPPPGIAAIIAGLLTKIGVYALIRTFTLLFPLENTFAQPLLLVLAGVTMIIGILGAIAHHDFRKILSFQIISHIGYMVMGLALFSPLALAGAIFYIIHHILVQTNLFLISGMAARHQGTFRITALGGIYDKLPFIATLFAIAAFSLAGIPPLSGFWGKYLLVKAGLVEGQYFLVGIALLTAFLTLFSMAKIWKLSFLPKLPADSKDQLTLPETTFLQQNKAMIASSVILISFTLLLSFYAQPLIHLSERAAQQLLSREQYIQTVLNKDAL